MALLLRKLAPVLSACAVLVVLSPSPSTATTPSQDPVARRGCCSHHGGVSGSCCSNGNALCNDNTCSPTCGC